jgi:hypothetical protein
MRRIYLAGPMRGIKDLNFPLFDDAADFLRRRGYKVFNPADNDRSLKARGIELNIRICLGDDLAWICKHADGIALLPDWEHSKGATAEKYTADALGLQIFYLYKKSDDVGPAHDWSVSNDYRTPATTRSLRWPY